MPAERTPHSDDSLLAQPLLAVTEHALRSPGMVLCGAMVLALLSIVVTLNGLAFKTSRLDLLNPRSDYNRRWLGYLQEFGDRDDAVLVVRGENSETLQGAIDDLAARLRAEPQWFESVFHRRDLSALKRKALHYLPQEELVRIETQLNQAVTLTASFPGVSRAGGSDPIAILATLNDQLSHVGAASPEQRASIEAQYASAAGSLLAAVRRISHEPGGPAYAAEQSATGVSRAPERSASGQRLPPVDIQQLSYSTNPAAGQAMLAEFEPQYLLADEGRLGFVLTKLVKQRGESAPNSGAIARARDIIHDVQSRHPAVWIGLTGMPVIEHDEMHASQVDMVWTSALSLVGVALLFATGYGGLRHAVLACCVLLLGMTYSFGMVTLVIGHLNILSAAFGVVLIGLGIDFGIHYVASYLKLRGVGCDEQTALLRTAVEVGPAVVTGGVTTSAAFFMAAMTDFVGIRELGVVAGGGLLLCVVTAVIVLPPLILVVDRRWPLKQFGGILPAGQWLQASVRWPRAVIALGLAAALIFAVGIFHVRYDHNLLNLQPRHLESADIERLLLTHQDDSVWYAVSVCNSPQEVRERKVRFERLPIVAKTEEIASLLPEHSAEQANRIESICRLLASLPSSDTVAAPALDPNRLQYEIERGRKLLARETPYETAATIQLAALQQALVQLSPRELERRLSGAAQPAELLSSVSALREIADPLSPRLEDLPRELVDRFVGANRCFLLKVYGKGNIWDMEALERFVHDIESIDPRVTGHPVQTYYASRHMQQSYLWAGLYAVIAVFALLFIDFRSLRHSLLAMVPLAAGALAMCGLFGWLDVAFNPANMIVLPLILGIGVDDGVHLVHVWRQQQGRFRLGDATAIAIALTSATTMASFGSLILARHQGLQSLGQVLTLGVFMCLVTSLLVFPALLSWLGRSRDDLGTDSTCDSPGAAPLAVVQLSIEQPVKLEVARTDPTERDTLPAEDDLQVATPSTDAEVAENSVRIDQQLTVSQTAETNSLSNDPDPVTDEEIAALLESAYVPRVSPRETLPAEETPSSPLRRRRLPRRATHESLFPDCDTDRAA